MMIGAPVRACVPRTEARWGHRRRRRTDGRTHDLLLFLLSRLGGPLRLFLLQHVRRVRRVRDDGHDGVAVRHVREAASGLRATR